MFLINIQNGINPTPKKVGDHIMTDETQWIDINLDRGIAFVYDELLYDEEFRQYQAVTSFKVGFDTYLEAVAQAEKLGLETTLIEWVSL